ncbi:hypothetical protein HDU96_005519, partial [Phlyctochytrium bullatum]
MASKIKDVIYKHYRDATYHRTEAQIQREQWLIPGVVRFNRWVLFPAALLIQLCCGSLYAWSGYNSPIETAIWGPNGLVDRAMAVNAFYIAVAVFGCTAAVLGPWLERNGPLRGALLGAALFFFGNLVTALGVWAKQISIVYIGYGVFAGAGLGVAYIAPVSPLQKWFPEIRGLAAGFAVCGFGGGSIIAPYTQKALIGPDFAKLGDPGKNLGVPLTFVVLGSVYFVLMVGAGVVLRMPPPGYEVNGITIDTVKGAERADGEGMAGSSRAAARAEMGEDKNKEEKEKAEFLVATTTTTTIATTETIVEEPSALAERKSTAVIDIEDAPSHGVNRANMFAMTLWESLTSLEYLLMYFMFFGSQVTGLLIISKIQQITVTQLGRTTDEAALILSLNAEGEELESKDLTGG